MYVLKFKGHTVDICKSLRDLFASASAQGSDLKNYTAFRIAADGRATRVL